LQPGVRSRLSIYPGLPHVWQITVGIMPESRLALEEAADFITANIQASTRMNVAPASTGS
jgi:hypothetical protein